MTCSGSLILSVVQVQDAVAHSMQFLTGEYRKDTPPEIKIGLLPGSAPKTLKEVIVMMHPDDTRSYQALTF